jgi:site-specific DNA recombinase
MLPTHATKHGVRYRYYVSQPYLHGHAKPPPGLIIRAPATEIERAVVTAIADPRRHIIPEHESRAGLLADVARLEVRESALALWLKAPGEKQREADADHLAAVDRAPCLLIPWTKPPPKMST